jgi:hypothetical protein
MPSKYAARCPNNLTTWGRISDPMPSQWGGLNYLEWCEREAARMTTRTRTCVVVLKKNLCAVAVKR